MYACMYARTYVCVGQSELTYVHIHTHVHTHIHTDRILTPRHRSRQMCAHDTLRHINTHADIRIYIHTYMHTHRSDSHSKTQVETDVRSRLSQAHSTIADALHAQEAQLSHLAEVVPQLDIVHANLLTALAMVCACMYACMCVCMFRSTAQPPR